MAQNLPDPFQRLYVGINLKEILVTGAGNLE
jgi:hypothetical protein